MDKYRGITKLPLAEARINHLLGRLSANRAVGSYTTQEELIRAYADICNRIFNGFGEQLYDLPEVVKGTPVNETNINLYLLGIYSEILYLLKAIDGTALMAEENFNFVIAQIRGLQAQMKYCRQQLSTFALYATQFGSSLHFGETFSNETNIDRGSVLLGQEECFINTAEGTVSLPRLEENDQWKIEKVEVGATSNGVLGNNVEANTPVRGSIRSLYDRNVDTWTEYERVVDIEDTTGLKLELKINLSDIQPVNGIKISPVFLGARTPFYIQAIEVSSDGREWVSLKDDVRVADFLDEDLEERYHLSPHSSRFAGEFNITFAPRFVKFIRILIRQSSAFSITDVYGNQRLRYVIAIREISIFGHKYSSAGELISKPLTFSKNISALGIRSLVDPPDFPAEIGGLEYFLSYDDGASWSKISPLQDSNLEVPEILYPPEEISSIRYKLRLSKDELAFSQQVKSVSLRPFSERFPWSVRRPFVLNLFHLPVSGTVTVCNPNAAARGRVYPRTPLGYGVSSSLVQEYSSSVYRRHGNTQLRLKLPLKVIKDPSSLYLYVNNSLWTRVSSISDLTDEFSNEYIIERGATPEGENGESWEVVFGNDSASDPLGRIPGSSDSVSLYLSEERCVVEGLSSPYRLRLDYPSDGIKANTSIRFHGGVYTASPETVPRGVTKFSLSNKHILVGRTWRGRVYQLTIHIRDSGGLVGNAVTNGAALLSGSFRNYQSFVDGNSELSAAGDWTVDSEEGVVYLYTATESDKEYTVTYWWEDLKELTTSDWDFVEGSLDEIQIYESGYKTQEGSVALSSIASVGDFSANIISDSELIRGIVSKSIRIQNGTLGGYRALEIPFIDGHTEFEGRAKLQDEAISTSLVSDSSSFISFRLTHWQTLITSAAPSFDDVSSVDFITEKANKASCTVKGDWFFDATGEELAGAGYIYVHMGGVGVGWSRDHTVSYQYEDEFSAERMKGGYSVNPIDGIVYFAVALSSSDILKTIAFKYTPYRARYNISTQLEKGSDYEIDGQQVTILTGALNERENLLTINYKYEPEELKTLDLAPYFSPLVRALDIRVD